MLMFELRRIGRELMFPMPKTRLDTVQLAKPLFNGKFMKLQQLYENMVGPYEQKHRAIDDCFMLQKVYHEIKVRLEAKENGHSS